MYLSTIFLFIILLSSSIFAGNLFTIKDKKRFSYYKLSKYLIIKNKQLLTSQRQLFHQNLLKNLQLDEDKQYAINMKKIWEIIDAKDDLLIRNKIFDRVLEKERH